MGKYSQYNILLKSIEEGKHEFNYHLINDFFKLLGDEDVDIKKGDVNVNVVVKKTSTAFELNFVLLGEVRVPCDRCLDEMPMNIDVKSRLIVKFGKEYSEESDEIVVIPEEDGAINIAWFLYEFIALSLPMKRVHPSGECNRTMASKLKKHKTGSSDGEDDVDDGDNDDLDLDDVGDSPVSDSRWDALKDLPVDE